MERLSTPCDDGRGSGVCSLLQCIPALTTTCRHAWKCLAGSTAASMHMTACFLLGAFKVVKRMKIVKRVLSSVVLVQGGVLWREAGGLCLH